MPALKVDHRDLVGGLALFAIGAFFTFYAVELGIGTTRRMGAGYFPMLGGVFVMAASLFVVGPALARTGAIERPSLRPFLAVGAAIAAFVVAMPLVGLLPSVVVTVLVAAMGDRKSRILAALVLAFGVAAMVWVVFLVVLGLPMRPYRMPF